jgi:hypothetical protein
MFLYNKPYEVSGSVLYENYNTGTAQLSSGLKVVNAPAHLTGTVRFRVAGRGNRVIPSKEGRTSVKTLTVQFGWDEIRQLEQKDIYLTVGKFKMEYGGTTYRLTDMDDFGQDIDRIFNNVGLIEATFEKERPNL